MSDLRHAVYESEYDLLTVSEAHAIITELLREMEERPHVLCVMLEERQLAIREALQVLLAVASDEPWNVLAHITLLTPEGE